MTQLSSSNFMISVKVMRNSAVVAIPALAVLLAGCKGIPTKALKQARRQAETSGAGYRPAGATPVLTAVTTDCSMRNYVTFATLNQPQVEASYYDWAGSVERITQARSFPDPQLTFQMDIQSVVTSIMPGLMGNIPWPDKLRV